VSFAITYHDKFYVALACTGFGTSWTTSSSAVVDSRIEHLRHNDPWSLVPPSDGPQSLWYTRPMLMQGRAT
jgi:hypothetical protein